MATRDSRILPGLMVLLVSLCAPTSTLYSMRLAEGVPQVAPDFSLPDLAGRTISVPASRDTLLLFGTIRCPHCQSALQSLELICGAVGDQLAVYFIAIREDSEQLRDFFGSDLPAFGILLDKEGHLSARFGVTRVPTCVLIGRAGRIRYLGRFDPPAIWRALTGESINYPDVPYPGIGAGERIAARPSESLSGLKRYIVELDESPGASKKLPKKLLEARQERFRRAAERIGARIVHNYGRLKNKLVVEIPAQKAQRLAELPAFRRYAEDRRVHALLEDSAYQIRADYAWDNAVTGQGVKVCVVDTGIDYSHPDLKGKVIAQHNFVTGTEDAMDDQGHGTHVAGIIASEGLPYRGVAHDVSLLAAKVLDYTGSGYSSDVALGINWCVEQGAQVINLSLGEGLYSGTCDYEEMAGAVNEAVNAGVIVVCAAGNDGDATRMVSPACASGAVAVGAVDKLDNIASYSDGGDELDLVAPGGDQLGGTNFPEIVSAYSTEVANNPAYCMYLVTDECWDEWFLVEGDRYIRAIGTSMAAPHAAAAAALLLEQNPALTPQQVKTVLEENADDLGTPGWDNVYGWGRINIEKALDNLPPRPAELRVQIDEPNAADSFFVGEPLPMAVKVDCSGGDGCGRVDVYAQFCGGQDCTDFIDINSTTTISTLDNNPNELGVLSGYSVDTDLPVVFDAQTVHDASENTYVKLLDPDISLVGSTKPGTYSTGDLEPRDGIGAIGEDAEELYSFEIPPGVIKTIKVRMENYLVMHFDYPPFAGWYVYTSNAAGDNIRLIGDCIPAEGGGGETPPPDCWFVSDDPNVLADLSPGATNYIKLVSHDVGENDWLTFNDIEVIIEYEPDPNNDEVYRYYVKFDLNDVDVSDELTAARLKINVAQASAEATAEVHLADNLLLPDDPAEALHEVNVPAYSSLLNPVKSFSCKNTGIVNLNVKAAVEEALLAGQSTVAFQLVELGEDKLFAVDAYGGDNPITLTISQKVPQGAPPPDAGGPGEPNSGPRPLAYETLIVRDISEDTYSRYDSPDSAVIGAEFAAQYSTGDLEPRDGIGAIGEDAQEHYEFTIPAGQVKTLKVRMENYLVMHFDYPPFAGWYVYTSDASGSNLHLVGDCIPAEGGGGEPQPPDCWFVSTDPNVLADLSPGGTNYIKLVSHDVGQNDWITFNDIEVIVEHQVDPNSDNISRYYLKFDLADLPADAQIDTAALGFYVTDPAVDSIADISLVETAYDPCTAAYIIYDAADAPYSSLSNPIKSIACDTPGPKRVNVKAAIEDAVQNAAGQIAFLITEQGEDALFAIDPAGGANPPHLDVYLKSGLSTALAKWSLLPSEHGKFTLRALVVSDIGAEAVSDALVVNIHDPNLPMVNSVECMIDSAWQDCRNAGYSDVIQKIRIDAEDPQEIPQVRLTVTNVPDRRDFVDEFLTYGDGYFMHAANLELTDSGQWMIKVVARDSEANTDTQTITWNIPWGDLSVHIATPGTEAVVPKGSSFPIEAEVQCAGGECPLAKARVQLNRPVQAVYDDATAETYGEIGDADSYIAVRITPETYPAELKTARFYVWDTTTYPFNLHVWDDDGPGGAPGSPLIEPFVVDPVVPSASVPEVAWFDVDLSGYNIVIDSGDLYIGWQQVEGSKNNQVGFDTDGPRYRRTWGYHWTLGGWFNLDDWGWLIPDFYGNIMIRAILGEPGSYQGDLPETVGPAPFYTTGMNPSRLPHLNAGDLYDLSLQVHAVGAPAQNARFYALAANNYSMDVAGPLKVTITEPLSPCDAANLNAVSPIDYKDLSVLAGQWLSAGPILPADINADGSANFKDLAFLADYWLVYCE